MFYKIFDYIILLVVLVTFLMFLKVVFDFYKNLHKPKEIKIDLEEKVKDILKEDSRFDFENWNAEDITRVHKIIRKTEFVLNHQTKK